MSPNRSTTDRDNATVDQHNPSVDQANPDNCIRDIVVTVLSDVLAEPASALAAEPVLAVHAWDSIASLEALVQIETRLDVRLDLRAYHAARDIDDLVELVAAARGIQSTKVRP